MAYELYRMDYPYKGEMEDEPYIVTDAPEVLVRFYETLRNSRTKDMPRKYLLIWRASPKARAVPGLIITRDSTGRVGFSPAPTVME